MPKIYCIDADEDNLEIYKVDKRIYFEISEASESRAIVLNKKRVKQLIKELGLLLK